MCVSLGRWFFAGMVRLSESSLLLICPGAGCGRQSGSCRSSLVRWRLCAHEVPARVQIRKVIRAVSILFLVCMFLSCLAQIQRLSDEAALGDIGCVPSSGMQQGNSSRTAERNEGDEHGRCVRRMSTSTIFRIRTKLCACTSRFHVPIHTGARLHITIESRISCKGKR